MEGGNNDLVIFIVLALAPPCFEIRWRGRNIPAWALLLTATALKYFPVAGYILFVKNTRTLKELLWYAVFALSAYFAAYIEEFLLVPEILRNNDPASIFTFGAKGFFYFAGFNVHYTKLCELFGCGAVLCGATIFISRRNLQPPMSSSWRENYFILGVAVSMFIFSRFGVTTTGSYFSFLRSPISWILQRAQPWAGAFNLRPGLC